VRVELAVRAVEGNVAWAIKHRAAYPSISGTHHNDRRVARSGGDVPDDQDKGSRGLIAKRWAYTASNHWPDTRATQKCRHIVQGFEGCSSHSSNLSSATAVSLLAHALELLLHFSSSLRPTRKSFFRFRVLSRQTAILKHWGRQVKVQSYELGE
jgi:hypothetical protein